MKIRRKKKRQGPGYEAKLLEETKDICMPGQVTVVNVAHDDWCDFLKDGGKCNCDPDLSYSDPVGERNPQ